MCIQRDDQARWREARPDAQVDLVAADHPTQEQVEPFAGAPGRGTREEIGHAALLWHPAAVGFSKIGGESARRERVERRADVRLAGFVALEEEGLDRS